MGERATHLVRHIPSSERQSYTAACQETRAGCQRGRALERRGAGPLWWTALVVLLLLGLGAGVWCGFYCEYHYSDSLRVFSFPVPAAFFRLENGDWVDYVSPAAHFIALLNAVCVTV